MTKQKRLGNWYRKLEERKHWSKEGRCGHQRDALNGPKTTHTHDRTVQKLLPTYHPHAQQIIPKQDFLCTTLRRDTPLYRPATRLPRSIPSPPSQAPAACGCGWPTTILLCHINLSAH